MKSRLLVAAVACLGYAILNATPANAADKYAHSTGDWSGANVWYSDDCESTPTNGVTKPTSADHAYICGVTVTVEDFDEAAQQVTVKSSGMIEIDPDDNSRTLTLGSGEAEALSTLESTAGIRLKDDMDGTNVAKLTFATVDHRFRGLGRIVGEDVLAQVDIPSLLTMTIDVDSEESPTGWVSIEGRLKIMGSGTFDNQRQVHANADGTLDMLLTGMIQDTAITGDVSSTNHRWGVSSHTDATLRFNNLDLLCNADKELLGAFYVGAGTLRIGSEGTDDIEIEVTDRLLLETSGKVEAGPDDSIAFNVTCP
ncbi:MAG: hypothetical protein JSU86_11760 [Phycisphaerales bacterium]|nr:MAG: hypothetical protein JSU86_11760 [Phycisphaerales bacterium]